MRFAFTKIVNPAQWSNETQSGNKTVSFSGLVNLDDWGTWVLHPWKPAMGPTRRHRYHQSGHPLDSWSQIRDRIRSTWARRTREPLHSGPHGFFASQEYARRHFSQ